MQNAVDINVDPALPVTALTAILPKRTSSIDPLESVSEGDITASGVFMIQQEFDDRYAITNIDFVKQQLGFGADEYSAVEIKLKPGADMEAGKPGWPPCWAVPSMYKPATSKIPTCIIRCGWRNGPSMRC